MSVRRVIDIHDVEPMQTNGVDFRDCFCRFAISKETMGTNACMFRATFLPGGFHAPHHHTESDEFFYVISCGSAVTGIEEKVYEMREGMFFYFPRNVKHWTKNTDPKANLEVVTCYPHTGNIDDSGYVYKGEAIPPIDLQSVIRGG